MVVSVRLQASDRVLFLKLEVVDESLKQIAGVRHLLQAREEARLTRLRIRVFLGCSHVRMVSNL